MNVEELIEKLKKAPRGALVMGQTDSYWNVDLIKSVEVNRAQKAQDSPSEYDIADRRPGCESEGVVEVVVLRTYIPSVGRSVLPNTRIPPQIID